MRLASILVGISLVGLVAVEIAMRPSASERWMFVGVFAAVAFVTAGVALLLRRVNSNAKSLYVSVVMVAVGALTVAALAVVASATLMFLSPHDLRLVLLALGLGVALGVAAAASLSSALTSDLRQIAETAQKVGDGDLSARTGIERADEMGTAADAVDDMIGRLDEARRERDRIEAARREFFASIGHDLRTPLTSLRAAVEALQDGVATDPDRYFAAMVHDLDILRALVDDLFLLARIEAGDIAFDHTNFDLAEIADEAVEAMAPIAERKGVELSVSGPGSLSVTGAPTEMGRAIRNLLDNAIRHAPSKVAVSLAADNGNVLMSVEDDGPGFGADIESRAFEVFSREDPARARASGGAGLGLAITKAVVEAHGGSVWIDTGPGGRVSLALPRPT